MAQHIVLMSAVAPCIGYVLVQRLALLRGALFLATAVQIVLLWAWHAPPVMPLLHRPLLSAAANLSLFLSAVWFWNAVWSVGGNDRWRAIVALLITSKLFCLLGALLIFAPRPLYAANALPQHVLSFDLADQHLAGLMMIVACPLTYVLAGVICSARWFTALERSSLPVEATIADG